MGDKKKDCGRHDTPDALRRLCGCLLAVIITVLLIVLIVWLVLRPTKPRFSIQDASVISFNLTSTAPPSALTAKIQVTLASRNPNNRVGIRYDRLDVYATYRDQPVTLPSRIPTSYYQGHGDVAVWSPFLFGDGIPMAPYLTGMLAQDEAAGRVVLHVKVDGRIRWKVGSWTSGKYRLNVDCPAVLVFDGMQGGGGYASMKIFQYNSCKVDV